MIIYDFEQADGLSNANINEKQRINDKLRKTYVYTISVTDVDDDFFSTNNV